MPGVRSWIPPAGKVGSKEVEKTVVAALVVEFEEGESEFEEPLVVAAEPLFLFVDEESLEAVLLCVLLPVWETVSELLEPVALAVGELEVCDGAELDDELVSRTTSASNSGNHFGHGHAVVKVEKQRIRKVVYSWNDREVLIVSFVDSSNPTLLRCNYPLLYCQTISKPLEDCAK